MGDSKGEDVQKPEQIPKVVRASEAGKSSSKVEDDQKSEQSLKVESDGETGKSASKSNHAKASKSEGSEKWLLKCQKWLLKCQKWLLEQSSQSSNSQKWLLKCQDYGKMEELGSIPWQVSWGGSLFGIVLALLILAKPPSQYSQVGVAPSQLSLGCFLKTVYCIYKISGAIFQLVLDIKEIYLFFHAGSWGCTKWQSYLCFCNIICSSPNMKNSLAGVSLYLVVHEYPKVEAALEPKAVLEYLLKGLLQVLGIFYLGATMGEWIPALMFGWLALPVMLALAMVARAVVVAVPAYGSLSRKDKKETISFEEDLYTGPSLVFFLVVVSPSCLCQFWGTDGGYWKAGLSAFSNSDLSGYIASNYEKFSMKTISAIQWIF